MKNTQNNNDYYDYVFNGYTGALFYEKGNKTQELECFENISYNSKLLKKIDGELKKIDIDYLDLMDLLEVTNKNKDFRIKIISFDSDFLEDIRKETLEAINKETDFITGLYTPALTIEGLERFIQYYYEMDFDNCSLDELEFLSDELTECYTDYYGKENLINAFKNYLKPYLKELEKQTSQFKPVKKVEA